MRWTGEPPDGTNTALEGTILEAVRSAIEAAAAWPESVVLDADPLITSAEPFLLARYRADRATYALPSYDNGGAPTEVPVEENAAGAETDAGTEGAASLDPQEIAAHILHVFGTYGPVGMTHYGVQTEAGLFFIQALNGDLRVGSFGISGYRKDVRGHWESLGTDYVYSRGRYTFEVTSRAKEEDPLFPNVGRVTDLEGHQYGETIYTPQPVGFRIVFDVPHAIRAGGAGGGAAVAGDAAGGGRRGGILPGRGLIPLECHPLWDTRPLTDLAYAGMRDDDLERLFLNLCNARAIENLDLSEQYIREELVLRYTGPNGATNLLSDYSRHELQHFREDLNLLRGLMLSLNQLGKEIDGIQTQLDPLITRRHRTHGQFLSPLGFGAPLTADVFWPTYVGATPEDRPRVEQLMAELNDRGERLRTVLTGITVLVRQDPFLTQFITGLDISHGVPSAEEREKIGAELADVADLAMVQHQLLQKLDRILASIAMAREKLCRDPKRVLDVPMVYEQVLQIVGVVSPHFNEVANALIDRHQRQERWTDIGLGAAGLALFVGGLIVSLAGGPAGVIAFLELAGTGLSAISALRSADKATFFSTVASAAVQQGQGLVTLRVAREAQFWAAVDAVLLSVDVGLGAIKAARVAAAARKTEALAAVARGAERFGESVEAAQRIPFDELLKRAAPRGRLPIAEAELAKLRALGSGVEDIKTAGRIAEELAERVVGQSGQYVQLATKLDLDRGIDLLYVRRSIFEQIFGRLANPSDASRLFARAAEPERQRLLAVLKKAAADDLVSLEVKFTRSGLPAEEFLKAAKRRGGIQQHREWYRGLIPAMREAAEPEVRATGRLLEEVIGAAADRVDRLTRVGISIDPQGAFKLTPLSDELIEAAARSQALRGKRYFGLQAGLLEAERRGQQARADKIRSLLSGINREMDTLDRTVRELKQASTAAKRLAESLQRASEALRDVDTLRRAVRTPATLDALFVANATARLHLEVAKQSLDEADSIYLRGREIIESARAKQVDYEAAMNAALNEWDRLEPGTKERLLRLGEAGQRQQQETVAPSDR